MSTATDTPAGQLAAALVAILTGVMDAEQDGAAVKIDAAGVKFTLTVTEGDVATDPLADITEYGRQAAVERVEQEVRDADKGVCKLRSDKGWVCNRATGHPGKHIAVGGHSILEVWDPKDMPPDPLARVQEGDPDSTLRGQYDDWDDCIEDACDAFFVDREDRGHDCTRKEGHPGKHIEGNGERITGVERDR